MDRMNRSGSDRDRLAAVAAETVAILRAGGYRTPAGERIELGDRLANSIRDSRLYLPADFPPLLARVGALSPRSEPVALEFTGESTLEAIRRLHADGAHGAIACLNFASARNPGGGYLSGSRAQEESLARSSTLVPSLERHSEMYRRNRAGSSLLYLDAMIHSPGVLFFRDDDGALLERPSVASVISAPAPNTKAIRDRGSADLARVGETLRERARMILATAVENGTDALILGAWGCGVFGNDPDEVAEAFGRLLRPGAPFFHRFRRVVFAVFDRSPGAPLAARFRRRIEGTGGSR